MTFRQVFKRVLTPPLMVAVAAYVLFEDTILHWATLAMRRVSRLPAIAWLERQIGRLPPYPALLLFALPIALLFPVKLLALWAIARGHLMFGTIVVLAAKTVSTTLEAALYRILRPSLARLGWFVRAETWLFAWRDRLYGYVRALPAWQRLSARIARAKAWLRRSFSSLRGSASQRQDMP